MNAMVMERAGELLVFRDRPVPEPGPGQVQVRVRACAVCRTDLHILDGELPDARLPLIPGHEVAGVVSRIGPDAHRLKVGDRVGIPWLGWSCGACAYCCSDRENLCDHARFTGYHLDGGYAEYCVADERFVLRLPPAYPDEQAAPLLCAGLIGFRALRMAGQAARIGFYGFGAAAHILVQAANARSQRVFAFTRPGDSAGQAFARSLGAVWAGGSDQIPPEPLEAAIIFAPVGALVPQALRAVGKGGTVICAGIHMTDIPSFPYSLLWQERIIRSVANLTRQDGEEFFDLAGRCSYQTHVTVYDLKSANQALADVRNGSLHGAAVLRI